MSQGKMRGGQEHHLHSRLIILKGPKTSMLFKITGPAPRYFLPPLCYNQQYHIFSFILFIVLLERDKDDAVN